MTLKKLLQTADAKRHSDGTWTVYSEGFDKPGKINCCVGANVFEAIEDAFSYIEYMKRLCKDLKKVKK